ncbi:unnamed protein product [Euphydryas editha]|uniref:DDE-1 domain-containing protein n=1 Tax=Euphydryas editha TaxID=104508 RepID=A0AAU9UQ09_EUPED|nr:unnamed protein product [Euphydryas editha]
MAGIDGLKSFRKRHNELSLRKPETCGFARATAFDKDTVNVFFDNLQEVYNGRSSFADGAPPGSLGLATSSGWMNSELFITTMKHFIKHTSSSMENPSLLIMDNHESHLSIEALDLAKENGVTILTLKRSTGYGIPRRKLIVLLT